MKTMLAMQRLLRESIPGSTLKARFSRARVWLYAGLKPAAGRIWIRALTDIPLLAAAARRDRRFAEKPFHRFGRAGLDAQARATLIAGHYAAMSRLLGDSWLERLYVSGEPVVLASCEQFEIVAREVTLCKREGLLSISMRDAQTGVDLAWISVIFEQDTHRRTGVFIGGLQGPSGEHRDRVRAVTRACDGLRPKAAVIEALCAMGRELGLARIVAVARASHISSASDAQFRSDYDTFWLELGGVPIESGYALPLSLPHRAIEDVPSNKRSAFRRRQALIASMSAQIQDHLRGAKREGEFAEISIPTRIAKPLGLAWAGAQLGLNTLRK
ncbi:hypothetical protein F4827_002172 [Paraburkholderia bannensis]|uniref:DUF535 domain-containing protein n=1 Tax=Paraburkholderia bannensis TaxID=765414 RepID=A0A7W9TVS5_9BURK|nr:MULTISPECIES: DUF535 family protein [Paraburkholderia]MBB3257281.1 hypothetical protein [Paraburkholderia sp. WP4_3_2]MBB6102323.1 hypothetical protein [Paraburkholderia bannensis]